MDVSALRYQVYLDLGESNIGNDRVTPPLVLSVLNQVYEEVLRDTGCCVRSASISGTSGIFTLPTDMCAIRAANDGAVTLQAATLAHIEMMSPAFRASNTGTPKYYYMHDSRRVGTYPVASTLTVEATVIPSDIGETDCVAPLVDDTDAPAFNPSFHKVLVHGAVASIAARFLMDAPETQAKATEAQGKYDRMVRQMQDMYATGVSLAPRVVESVSQ